MVTLLARRGAVLTVLVIASLVSLAATASATPALDTSFGGGVLTPKVFPDGKSLQIARSAVIQPDGKVLVPMALSVKYGRRSERPVLRYKTDGTLDRSFGKNGAAWFGVAGEKYVGLTGISLQADGKALVSGGAARTRLGLGTFFIARLTRTGKLDRNFGRNGVTRLSADPRREREIVGTFPLKDGRTIVVFRQSRANDETLFLVRLEKNGRVDSGYADHGIKTIDVAHGHMFPVFADIAIAGDDLFALVNPDEETTRYPCKLVRTKISSTGGRVKGFGKNGTVTIAALKPGDAVSCRELALTADGGVAVAATVSFNNFDGTSAGLVYKFRADGTRDPAFGVGGRIQAPDQDDFAGIAELPGGAFLAVGTRGDADSPSSGPSGGIASVVDARGGLQDLLAGRVLPRTVNSYLTSFDHGTAGTVVLYTSYGLRGEAGTHIAKFTN